MTSNSKLVIKNGAYLAVRLLFVLCISFYTTRITLDVLGDVDFGIYNIVGGVIVIFSIIMMPLSSTLQRFFNVEFVKGQLSPSVVFSSATAMVAIFVIVIILMYETVGLYLVNNVLNLPAGSQGIVNIVFQIVVVTNVFLFLQLPFNSVLYAKEDMGYGALLEILLACYRLGMLFVIPLININILVSYSMILMTGYGFMLAAYVLYTLRKYPDCRLTKNISRRLCVQMGSFSGWNLIEAATGIAQTYGSNIIINLFGGVLFNTVYGITKQFSSAVMQFSTNVLKAVVPQITTSHESGNLSYRNALVLSTIKISITLIGFVCVVFQFSGYEVLSIWLGNVPAHVFHFLQVSLVTAIFASILLPLRAVILASGSVKRYFILYGTIGLSSIAVMYLLLKENFAIVTVMYILLADSVLYIVAALVCLQKITLFPTEKLMLVLLKCISALAFAAVVYWIVTFCGISSLWQFIIGTAMSFIILMIANYAYVLNNSERNLINKFFKKLIRK